MAPDPALQWIAATAPSRSANWLLPLTALQFRFVRAFEHWRGNTDLTLAAIILRTVEQGMRDHGGRQGS
jgi:hypothetical protein